MGSEGARFVRLTEQERPVIDFAVNGAPMRAMLGDTILTALLLNGQLLRYSEFGDGPRAGFCNMAACQDCWVELDDGTRLRACSTFVTQGMSVTVAERS